MSRELAPAVFLDRDGTLNVEKEYLHRREAWEWIDGARESIAALKAAGYRVIVVSNQSGIGRGMFTAAEVESLHDFMRVQLAAAGTSVDAVYYCPHVPEDGCACRKPAPGMLLIAAREHGLDLARSWMVGDKIIDVEAALAAGVQPLLVRTGHGAREASKLATPERVVENIAAATAHILR